VSEEIESLSQKFISYERLRGIKQTKNLISHLKPLFGYLESQGLVVSDVRVKQAQEFQTYLSTLRKKDGSIHYASLTVRSIMNITKRFYDFLKNRGVVYANPFMRIKRMKTESKLPRDIPGEEVMEKLLQDLCRFWKKKKLKAKKAWYKAHVMAEVMYATGMRIGEVLELKEEHIDFERRIIHVPKGKGDKERLVYLNEYASHVLKLYTQELRMLVNLNRGSERVFGIKNTSTIAKTFHKVLKTVGKKHGLKHLTSHSFRHSLGFHLLRRGCDLRYIQIILGHEQMSTTGIYTKVEKSDLKSVLDRCHPRQFKSIRHEKRTGAA
jgi:integrase/recombinase XerD